MAVIWKIINLAYRDAFFVPFGGGGGDVQFLTEARLTFRSEYAAEMI